MKGEREGYSENQVREYVHHLHHEGSNTKQFSFHRSSFDFNSVSAVETTGGGRQGSAIGGE